MDFKTLSGRLDAWIRKFRSTKFGKRLQYEPHIIKTVEYLSPRAGESLLVVFPEVDYLKSLILQSAPSIDYFGYDITSRDMLPERVFDRAVLFLVTRFLEKDFACSLCSVVKERIYAVGYLKGNPFFDITLRIVDSASYKSLGTEAEIFGGCKCLTLRKSAEFPSEHIAIKEYVIGG